MHRVMGRSATPLEQKIPLVPVETVGYDTVELEPRQIVAELDRFIIGQRDVCMMVSLRYAARESFMFYLCHRPNGV